MALALYLQTNCILFHKLCWFTNSFIPHLRQNLPSFQSLAKIKSSLFENRLSLLLWQNFTERSFIQGILWSSVHTRHPRLCEIQVLWSSKPLFCFYYLLGLDIPDLPLRENKLFRSAQEQLCDLNRKKLFWFQVLAALRKELHIVSNLSLCFSQTGLFLSSTFLHSHWQSKWSDLHTLYLQFWSYQNVEFSLVLRQRQSWYHLNHVLIYQMSCLPMYKSMSDLKSSKLSEDFQLLSFRLASKISNSKIFQTDLLYGLYRAMNESWLQQKTVITNDDNLSVKEHV